MTRIKSARLNITAESLSQFILNVWEVQHDRDTLEKKQNSGELLQKGRD